MYALLATAHIYKLTAFTQCKSSITMRNEVKWATICTEKKPEQRSLWPVSSNVISNPLHGLDAIW